MRTGYFSVLMLMILALSYSGCKEKETETGQDVSVKVNFRYGSQPLAYGQEYIYDTDKRIKIELAKFYVSKPALRNAAGEWIALDPAYYLVDLNHPVMQAGKLAKGTYTALRFGVGVDNSRNIQTDPKAIPATDYPTDHPLNAASDMYWSWATGYIFVKIEGRIDADNNGSYIDPEDKTVSYHPGVADLYREILLEKTFTVDGPTVLEISLDVEKLFTNINLLQNPYAHPNSTSHPEYNAAARMMDNFSSAVE